MPNCANCQTPLPASLDEYGPREAPLCRSCYLSQPMKPYLEDELREAERVCDATLSDLQDQHHLVDEMERLSQENSDNAEKYRGELESERKALELFAQRYVEASLQLNFVRARKSRIADLERFKLEHWSK